MGIRGLRLIERYIFWALVPYILLSALLLTSILFIQQLGRFNELLLGTRIPLKIIALLAASLLPNVLIFTLPMALLAGVIIGFSRLGSDSELIALGAGGVGTWKFLTPPLLIGAILTLFSLHVNINLAPEAARSLRRVAGNAALYKLDSPVEPRSFNTDIPGHVIYVRDGIKEEGLWGRVFLYKVEKDNSIRLVTARSGRIDSKGIDSELVLSDATLITLPRGVERDGSHITERLEQLRVSLDTGRKAILGNLEKDEAEPKPSEMGLEALTQYASTKEGAEKREAQILVHKRLSMSIIPLVFAFLGTMIGIRVRKGGRGAGMLLSLLIMLSYYIIMLAGEQMARAGSIPPYLGGWLAPFISVSFGLHLLVKRGRGPLFNLPELLKRQGRVDYSSREGFRPKRRQGKARLLSFPSLMDLDIIRLSGQHFILVFLSLISILFIFTLFELWRFIISNKISARVVSEYFLFLTPMVSIQLLPASTLIALLSTYALTTRRNEVIAWGSSGQSAYRLMVPGLIFALTLSTSLWLVQEYIMPDSNIRQDALRARIRGVSTASTGPNNQWLASATTYRLYSYELQNGNSLSNLILFDFDREGIHLQRVVITEQAEWGEESRLYLRGATSYKIGGDGAKAESISKEDLIIDEQPEVFRLITDKPSHLSAHALSSHLTSLRQRGADITSASVALQKKYANPFAILVMALIAIPLAISFGRRSTIFALCLAIALSLVYWAVTSGFQQLGEYGHLPPMAAVWSPILIFTTIGAFLLSRTRT